MNIVWKGSPNFTAGRGGKPIQFIVCHWIVGKLSAADAVFAKTGGTSAHYAVGNGVIHQYVKETDTAWHAGNFDANQRSIGIEHEGSPTMPITDEVYQTSAQLIADIWRRYGIIPLRKHSEFRATQCPGTLDLARLDRMARDIISPPDPCANLRHELTIRDNTIVALRNRVNELSTAVDAANTLIAQKNTEIGSLHERIAALPQVVEVIKEVTKTVEVEPSWWVKIKEFFRSKNV